MSISIKKSAFASGINMAPLIDIAFQLIIFFVLVSRFDPAAKELPVSLPQASAAAPLSFKPDELIVSVGQSGEIAVSADREGKIFDSKTIVTGDELDQILKQVAVNTDHRQSVKVRADKNCTWAHVVTVINACQKAGVKEYEVQTDPGQ